MGLAELFWAGGWSDHPYPSLHSKIFEKSKIDGSTWYLFSETLFKQFDITVSILNKSDAKFFCPLTYFLYNEYSKNDLLRLMVNFGPSIMEYYYDFDLR